MNGNGLPPVTQQVKNLPAMQEMQETWVQSQVWKDPLEEGMATHSSIFAWKIPRTEEPGRLQSMTSLRVRHDWACMHSHEWENVTPLKIRAL